MAKRFTHLKLRDYDKEGNEKEITLMYRFGPKATDLFQSISKVEITEENIKKLGMKGLVYQIYAGCQAMHHDLTIERVWDLVDNYENEEIELIVEQIAPEIKGDGPGNVEE